MAKHGFGKFLLVTGTVAAAAIGAYYYLQSKDEADDGDSCDDGFDDDLDDFDETDDTVSRPHNRTYVDLKNEAAEKAGEFKEGINAAAAKVNDKIVGEKAKYDKEGAEAVKKDIKDGVKSAVNTVKDDAGKVSDEIEDFFDDEDDDKKESKNESKDSGRINIE